jgi:DNA-binding MarR family transcriptional regulator
MTSAKETAPAKTGRGNKLNNSSEPAMRVLRRFRIVFNAVKAHFREVEKVAGVAGAQLWALSTIRDQRGLSMRDLASAIDVHQSTASNLVRALVEKKLVVVNKEGADRRTVQLKLTPAGMKVLRRAPGPFTGVLPAALSQMDPQTLTRLDKDLGKLIAALGADVRGARIPLGQG